MGADEVARELDGVLDCGIRPAGEELVVRTEAVTALMAGVPDRPPSWRRLDDAGRSLLLRSLQRWEGWSPDEGAAR